MKKIFTLIAALVLAASVSAQSQWRPDPDNVPAAGATLVDDDLMTMATVFETTVKSASVEFQGQSFSSLMQVRVDKAPTADTPTGTEKSGSTPLVVTPKKDITFIIYDRRQYKDGAVTSNDGKDVLVVNQADPTTVLDAADFVYEDIDGSYAYSKKTYALSAGNTYTVYARGTTLNLYGIDYQSADGSASSFSGSTTQDPTNNYATTPVTFSLTEVASALATDTATLAAALENWQNNTASADPMLFLLQSDGTESSNYTADGGGFYIASTGMVGTWGNDGIIFTYINWDTEADQLNFNMGQFPDSCKKGLNQTYHFILKYNGNQADFDIQFIVNPAPEVPAPTTIRESELNIVGNAETTVHQYPRTGYEADKVTIDITGAAAALGTDTLTLRAALAEVLYSTQYDATYGSKKDSLTNSSTATAPGWWLTKQSEDETGTISPEVVGTTWANTDAYYAEAYSYANDQLSFNLGQYPGNLNAGDTLYNVVYIIWADKAYKVKTNLIIDEPEYSGIEDMTCTGTTELNISQVENTVYKTTSFTIDTEAIAAELGCETSQLSLQVLDKNGSLAGTGTATNGGFWMTGDGTLATWGSSAVIFVEPDTEGDLSAMHIGQYPGNCKAGDEFKFKMYIVNEAKYHVLDFTFNITAEEVGDQSTWEVVSTKNAVIQVIASSANYIEDNNQTVFSVTPDECNNLIETSEPTLYCNTADSIAATGKLYAEYSDYLCTPAPGVWLGKEGQGHGWSGNEECPVGICYDLSSGQFTVYQVPGVNAVGSNYTTSLYLVNTETSKMIQVNFTIQFVESLVQVDEVGSENIMLPVDLSDNFIEIDLSKAATALETTEAELMGGYYLKGLLESGVYSEGLDPSTGCSFTIANGGYDAYGQIHVNFVNEGGAYQLDVISDEEVETGYKKEAKMCFEMNNKRYVYNITFLDPETYATESGITNITNSSNNNGQIYDLSGRAVYTPAKGIYIRNGKKFVVK